MLLNTLQHTGQPPNRATRPHGSAQRQVLQAGVGTKLPAFPEEGKGLWCPQRGGQEPWREAPRVWVPFWRITLFVYMSLSFPNPRQSRSNRPPHPRPQVPGGAARFSLQHSLLQGHCLLAPWCSPLRCFWMAALFTLGFPAPGLVYQRYWLTEWTHARFWRMSYRQWTRFCLDRYLPWGSPPPLSFLCSPGRSDEIWAN